MVKQWPKSHGVLWDFEVNLKLLVDLVHVGQILKQVNHMIQDLTLTCKYQYIYMGQ